MIKSKKIRISFMNLDEMLLTRVEGMATNGSINIDGASAVRRTCQLNFVSNDLKPVNYFELYKTKFLLEIDFGNGFKKQGIYLLTSFSSSISTNNYTFNISGKDKMCLLNGEHGGSFPFSIDVGTQEKIEYNFEPLVTFEYEPGKYYYQTEGEYVLDYSPYGTSDKTYYKRLTTSQKEKLTIKNIISNVVTVYGKEQKHNIFINDLEIKGLELLEYRGSDPLYLFRDVVNGKIVDMTIDGNFEVNTNDLNHIQLKEIPENRFFSTSELVPVDYNPIRCQLSTWPQECNIIRIQYGEPIGYRDTDLTYAGELTANINENVVSILDKIKNMLGNYEYFYDEEGHFIFQKRQDYVNNQFSTISVDGLGMEYASTPLYFYPQIELKNISSIGQNPQFQNIKNDFSIWGTRSGESGSLPIHSRIAIHQKPEKYVTYSGMTYEVMATPDTIIKSVLGTNKFIEDKLLETEETVKQVFLDKIPDEQISIYQNYFSNFISSCVDNEVIISDLAKARFNESLTWMYIVGNVIDYLRQLFADGSIRYGDSSNNQEYWGQALINLQNILLDRETVFTIMSSKMKRVSFADDIEFLLNNSQVYEIQIGDLILNDQIKEELNKYNIISLPSDRGYYEKTFFYDYDKNNNGVAFSQDISDLTPFEQFDFLRVKSYFDKCLKSLRPVDIYGEDNDLNNNWIQSILDLYGWSLDLSPNPQTGGYKISIVFSDGSALEYGDKSKRNIIIALIKDCNNNVSDQNQSLKGEFQEEVNDSLIKVSDWREILYQMAKDYYNNGSQVDFWQKINEYNDNQYLFQKTGYEVFYEDILGFWRQLYFDPLYESLDYELPIGYSLEDYADYNGWHRDVYENPAGLNFWIDFIEPSGELSAYAIDQIGVKGKYENSSTVKSIAAKQPPALKVLTNTEWVLLGENPNPDYSYVQLEGILANSYTISAQGISALEHTQNLLFNHTYLQESITLSLIPDESLKVNSRVKLNAINVNGEFTISKITLPLVYNGMMSVTLTKIPPTLTTEIIIKEFE